MVLLTAPGERLMRPQFGCRIWDLMFEPVNANLLGLISQAVRDALAQWEPRIEVEDVTPEQDEKSRAWSRSASPTGSAPPTTAATWSTPST